MGSSRAAVGRSLCGRGRERRRFGNVFFLGVERWTGDGFRRNRGWRFSGGAQPWVFLVSFD